MTNHLFFSSRNSIVTQILNLSTMKVSFSRESSSKFSQSYLILKIIFFMEHWWKYSLFLFITQSYKLCKRASICGINYYN